MNKLQKLSKKGIKDISKILPRRFKRSKIGFAQEDRYGINLFDPNKEYVTSIPKEGINLKKLTEDVVAVQGISTRGRPPYRVYCIKKNIMRWTISPKDETTWTYLPISDLMGMRQWLLDVDAAEDIGNIIDKLQKEGRADVRIPANREPYMKDIFKRGKTANPYKKIVSENTEYIEESFKSKWIL